MLARAADVRGRRCAPRVRLNPIPSCAILSFPSSPGRSGDARPHRALAALIMSTGTGTAGSRSLHTIEDEISPVRHTGALPQQQLTPASSQEAAEPASSSSGRTTTSFERIVGSHLSTEALCCPLTVTHGGEKWHAIKVDEQSWTPQDDSSDFFDTFKRDGGDTWGDFVVRFRVCAIDGHTATYVLRGGK